MVIIPFTVGNEYVFSPVLFLTITLTILSCITSAGVVVFVKFITISNVSLILTFGAVISNCVSTLFTVYVVYTDGALYVTSNSPP